MRLSLNTRLVPAGGLAIIALMTFNHLANDAFTSLLTPLLPQLQARYGASIAQTAVLVAILSFVGSMLQPLLGIVGDHIDRRLLAGIGPILAAAGMTLMGYAPNFAVLGLLIALGGIGSAIFHPSGAAYVALGSRAHQRGLWAAVFSAGGMIGLGIGPLFATALGLRLLPYLLPVGVITGIASYALAPSTRGSNANRRSFADYAAIWQGPIRVLWAASVLRSLATVSYNSLLGFMLTSYGAAQHIGLSLAVLNIASAFGGILGGRISDKLGRTTVLRSSILVTIPLFVGLVYSNPAQWWYYPVTALVGLLINANVPVAVVAAQEYAPRHVATASALMMGFSWGTAGVLFLIFARLADLTSPRIAMVASISMLLPALFLTLRLPEPKRATTG